MVLSTYTVWCILRNMDKFKTFFADLPPAEREHFAARCGTTAGFLRNVIYGQRLPGEKLCVRIERESGYVVTRCDLRRDWREIWPELIHVRGSSPALGEASKVTKDKGRNPSEPGDLFSFLAENPDGPESA